MRDFFDSSVLVAAFDEQRQFVVAHPLTAWDMLAPKRMR